MNDTKEVCEYCGNETICGPYGINYEVICDKCLEVDYQYSGKTPSELQNTIQLNQQ